MADLARVRSRRVLAWITIALLGVAAVVWGAGVLTVDLAGFDLLAGAEAGTLRLGAEEDYIDRAEAIGRLSILLNVVIGVCFLAWLYRAVANVPLLGGGDTRRSPAGAVGWWFVPIANIFVPYQVVADLDHRTATIVGAQWTRWLVLAWWLCWILGGVLARLVAATRVSPEPTFRELRELLELGTGADVLVMVAALLLIRIIWRVQSRQDERISVLRRDEAPIALPVGA